MENRVNRLHVEIFLHLNYEEIDHLLVRLQQIYRVVALAYQNLAVFAGQKLQEFLVDDGGMPEFE